MTEQIMKKLKELGEPDRAAHSQKYFRTGPGEYGEGDRFLGIRVPLVRKEVRKNRTLPLESAAELLQSRWHEARLFAVLVLVEKFKRGSEKEREQIFKLYLDSTSTINNWDLVDCSAPHIVGQWLLTGDRSLLRELALSQSIWERRISIIATMRFIDHDQFDDTLKIADMLLQDSEDLIHKAVGWMLREVGKRDRKTEEDFLRPRYKNMPRTMLRYAIEKFEPELRKQYLKGLV
ncbi:DNA alkylation repair protein [Candidatus Fermentibacteria bacterium]|nr:MAG: DNA alkylation repair protein [Candidatus Fermentibacteria bacterium]